MPVQQFNFGVGNIFGLRTDISNPTPTRLGVVQDVTVDMSFTNKSLVGQNQFPVDTSRGAGKVTGKVKNGTISVRQVNDFFFGQTLATGELMTVVDEGGTAGTAIPTTPFQITVSNAATFVDDLGVFNVATGIQMTRVASAPTAGQYSVNTATGIYTFSSADNVSGVKVAISYTYTQTTSGGRITAVNQLMGSSPVFKLVLGNSTKAKGLSLVLYQCVPTKMTMNFKNEDYMVPEFDFECFANSLGQVFDWSGDTL